LVNQRKISCEITYRLRLNELDDSCGASWRPGIHKYRYPDAADTLFEASSRPNERCESLEIAGRSCMCNGQLWANGRLGAVPTILVASSAKENEIGVRMWAKKKRERIDPWKS